MEVEKEGRKKEKEKSGREERQVGLKAGVKKKKAGVAQNAVRSPP